MKLYTYCTESHVRCLNEFFLPSLDSIGWDYDDIEVLTAPQDGEGGYFDDGFGMNIIIKLKLVLNAMKQNRGKLFLYSDVDVQFFKPFYQDIKDRLEEYDIVGQNNSEQLSGGFFACRVTEKIEDLFTKMNKDIYRFSHVNWDQGALHYFRRLVKWQLLPPEYFSYQKEGKIWEGEKISIPNNIVMHHANWVVGVDSKINMMKQVKKTVEELDKP